MNIFWAQIIICIQLDFAATCFFVYFEYIQIFIFSLHSMAVHAVIASGSTPPCTQRMHNIRLMITTKTLKYSKSYDQLKIDWGKIHVPHLLNHKSCFIAPPLPITTMVLP